MELEISEEKFFSGRDTMIAFVLAIIVGPALIVGISLFGWLKPVVGFLGDPPGLVVFIYSYFFAIPMSFLLSKFLIRKIINILN